MNIRTAEIDRLRDLIASASNMVILTGAGISTESGVPDFRSPGGLWEKFRIVEYDEYVASEEARVEDWHRRFYMADQIGAVEPNIGHKKVTSWLADGKASYLVTQNVDGLHLRAGAPTDRTIEIHGNSTTFSCIDCGTKHELALCRELFEKTGESPKCRACRGVVKADVVMFGEAMPREKTAQAFKVSETADLFLAIGTSLVVHPAAALPLHAKHNGSKFAIINRDATQIDAYADCVVNGEIGEVMRAL